MNTEEFLGFVTPLYLLIITFGVLQTIQVTNVMKFLDELWSQVQGCWSVIVYGFFYRLFVGSFCGKIFHFPTKKSTTNLFIYSSGLFVRPVSDISFLHSLCHIRYFEAIGRGMEWRLWNLSHVKPIITPKQRQVWFNNSSGNLLHMDVGWTKGYYL